jgi:hypothetical protein
VAWRRRDERWRDVLFVALWFAAFFAFFSAIPAKRHDLLLPVYPPVFMLAGLGLHWLTTEGSRRWTTLLTWALVLAATAGVVAVAVRNGGQPRFVVAATGIAACGLGALWLLVRDRLAALAAALLALTAMTAVESWSANPETRAYARLREFVEPVRAAARAGRVAVWQAHPLVSYELGLHQRELDLSGALAARPAAPSWLIAGKPLPEVVLSAAGATALPQARLEVKGQGLDVTLYQLAAKHSASSL